MKHLSKAIALAAVAAVFASCSKDENLYQGPQPGAERVEAYNAAFTEEFGEVAPSQNWGFYTVDTRTTRTAIDRSKASYDADRNIWYQRINYDDIPKAITETESNKVRDAFNDPTHPYVDLGLMSEFFCQHVYASHRFYKIEKVNNQSGQVSYDNREGSANMDFLYVYSTGTGQEEHVNNFNAANSGQPSMIDKDQNVDGHKDNSMWVHNAKSDKFSYHDSYSHEVYSDFKVKEVDGQYYLGFHYIIPNKDMGGEKIELKASDNQGNGYFTNVDGHTPDQAAGDPIYDDWIIKVTPAPYKPSKDWEGKETNGGRVMAEDLGAMGDWDFNDVVFDVVYNEFWDSNTGSIQKAPTLILRACGGTLPLTVAGYEVHAAFGVATNVMVNTGVSPTRPVAIISLAEDYGGDLAAIPIVVTQSDGTQIELTAQIGKPASKFLVPTSTRWMKEYKNIKTSYPGFTDWVGEPTLKWWETVNEEGNLY